MTGNGELFNEQTFKVVLSHDQQMRIILEPATEMTEVEIGERNEYYKKSLCPQLRYRKKDEVPVRTYKFKRQSV